MKIFYLIFVALIPFILIAQNQNNLDPTRDIIPRISASPEVATMEKFDYAPVNIYNGVPEISIPLYTIKEKGIELPIVLRYNSSGIRANEEATWVGLGWDLSIGAKIFQTPMGQPDQAEIMPYNTPGVDRILQGPPAQYSIRPEDGYLFANCSFPSLDNYSTFNLTKNYKYLQPDIYNYSIPGSSGQFIIDRPTNSVKFLGNRSSHVFIKELSPTGSPYSDSWSITDLNGIQYKFLSSEKETTNSSPRPSYSTLDLSSATWHLSSIISHTDIIGFTYTNGKVTTKNYSSYFNRQEYGFSGGTNNGNILNKDISYVKYLNKIESQNQRIQFILSNTSNERQDLLGETVNGLYSAKRLNFIIIWDKFHNRKVKAFKFNYDYFNSSNPDTLEYKRLKLISIQEIGYNKNGIGDTVGTYRFEYNKEIPLPAKHTNAIDYWGYYNGQTGNTDILPSLRPNTVEDLINENLPVVAYNDLYTVGNANRGVDSNFTTSGILKKIIYPTGGYVNFDYQVNDFTNYKILTASENTHSNRIDIAINDIKSGSPGNNLSSSEKLFPDKNGKLVLYNLSFGVTRLPNTLSNLTALDFKDARVRLMKGVNYPNALVKEWNMPAMGSPEFQDFSNQITQTGTGNYTFKLDKFQYQGDSNDHFWLVVSLGDQMPYTMCSFPCEAIASFGCYTYNLQPLNIDRINSYGAGLRIRSQKIYNLNDSLLETKLYSYKNPDGSSSGKLMSPPKFYTLQKMVSERNIPYAGSFDVQIYDSAYNFTISSNSNIPISNDAQGTMVGYDRVVITDINNNDDKNNGTTIHYFYNSPSQIEPTLSGVPNIPSLSNGLESRTEYYDLNQNLLECKDIVYSSISKEDNSDGAIIWDNYFGPDLCFDDIAGKGSNLNQYHGRWLVCKYALNNGFYKPTKVIDTEFVNNIPIVNKYIYAYNLWGQDTLESHLQLSKNENENKYYQYPIDFPNDTRSLLLSTHNQFNSILHSTTIRNNKNINEYNYNYLKTPMGDAQISSIQRTSNENTIYILDSVLYDNKDNIIQYKKNTEPLTTLIWGYNYQYPIAEVINENFENVFSIASISGINPSETKDTGQLKTTLSLLRTYYKTDPNTNISTFTYSPIIGLTSATDSRENTINYEYDNFGRLKAIRDKNGKILKSYEYHYRQ